jgi:hypothetical protein
MKNNELRGLKTHPFERFLYSFLQAFRIDAGKKVL